jgi:N-acetylglucosamine-6-sulfatase
MPALRRRLLGEGAVVENFMVNTPICCPSRTEFFTGRYFHNVGPPTVEGGCMHADTTRAGSNRTGMFGLMKRAGYNVGVFGKVTNDQTRMLQQLGDESSADFIDAPVDYNDYDGMRYWQYWDANRSTHMEKLSKTDPIFGTPYQTTQIGNRTLRWLDAAIDAATGTTTAAAIEAAADAATAGAAAAGTPFFAYIGPHAPHYPAQPAPWYEHAFDDVDAPRTPNYNLSSPDKAAHVRQNPPLDAGAACWENQHFRDRWSSLLSVDDLIRDVYDKLEARGVLDTTFILYSSDHGYKQGQWRIGTSKQHPYETDIRAPFIMRGPGVRAGANFTAQISGNVDVMPTMLHLAAGRAFLRAVDLDGRSMASFMVAGVDEGEEGGFADPPAWRDHFLNEYLSVATYWNDHSEIWQDGNTTSRLCGTDTSGKGAGPRGPGGTFPTNCVESAGVGDGKCYFVDSTQSNSWRQLRVNNATMNWNYLEYDPDWKFYVRDASGAGLQHYELYDIAADPYQMNNLYAGTSMEVRTALHAQLAQYYTCKGASCP